MFGKEPQITTGVGALLCVIGLLSRVLSDSTSITLLIPLFFGVLLLLLGWLALAPQRTKTMMHVVAALALLGVLGSLNVVPALRPARSPSWCAVACCCFVAGCWASASPRLCAPGVRAPLGESRLPPVRPSVTATRAQRRRILAEPRRRATP